MTNISECQQEKQISSVRRAIPQILAVLVKNILLLGYGMTVGFPTILIPNLSGSDPDEKIILGEDGISWIGSINMIFVPIGCLLSGSITHSFGRRRTMQLVNIPFLLAWLLFHFATETWHVFLALSLTGLTGGLLEAPTLTYVAEITTPEFRGILASTSSQAVILGVLTEFILGSLVQWRTVALICCIAPVASVTSLFFVPESPHWLIANNKLEEAHKAIAWLRGWLDLPSAEPEFKELCDHIRKDSADNSKKNYHLKLYNIDLYKDRSFLWPLGLISFVFALGHFSGMTTLQTYAVKIFATFQAPINKFQATNFLGLAEVLGCLLSAICVHFVGKRKLCFFSLLGSGICFLAVAEYAYLGNFTHIISDVKGNVSNLTLAANVTANLTSASNVLPGFSEGKTWLPLSLLILSAFCTHAGIRILPWMLIGEVFSPDTRAIGSGICGAVGYIFGFISNKIFFIMISWFTLSGTFFFYTCASLMGIVILHYILPETEGKTLHDITMHFRKEVKLGNKVLNVKRGKLEEDKANNGVINSGYDPEEVRRKENDLTDSKL